MPPRTTRTAATSKSPSDTPQPLEADATASTSSTTTTGDNNNNLQKKRKKLPACDACKLRRVLCKPQPVGIPCSRCKDKAIVCTTTPTVRKKAAGRTGKRIEEARAMFGAADPNAPTFMGASNTPWIQPRLYQPGDAMTSVDTLATTARDPPRLSQEDVEQKLAQETLNGALVAHLLELYQALPQSWLPIGVRGRMSLLFESAGRRMSALAPQAEVLAHAMIALTSRLSSHPALFSPGGPIPSFESLTPTAFAQNRDLREFGRRREDFCEKLKKRAVRLAWDRGTLVKTSGESMATCYLLEMLEGRNDPRAGKPYGSAFVSHLRTLLDAADEPGSTKVMNMSLGWSALIMREALYATNAGRSSHFTAADDRLLCGDPPASIEAALLETVDDVDLRDTVTLFFRPFRPYTYHCASLARGLSDNVTGTCARKQPLDELFVTKYLTHLDHLLHLFAVLESRIAVILSPAATSAHALPAPFEQERQFIMRACLYTLSLAWAGLSLPLYTDMKRRVAELEDAANDHPPTHSIPSQHRSLSRLRLLLDQVHSTTLKAAKMVAQCVREAPSLAFLTHLQSENLEKWSRLLIDARVIEDGGEGITREERRTSLIWIADGLKTSGWSWADLTPLINEIEFALQSEQSSHHREHPNDRMEQDEKMREILQGPLQHHETELPQPPPHFNVDPSSVHQAQDEQSPTSSDGFDYSSLLQNSQAPSPPSMTMPDLSNLASLFATSSSSGPDPSLSASMSLPSSSVPPYPVVPTSQPISPHPLPSSSEPSYSAPPPPLQQPPSLGPPPDLQTLITAYLNGQLVLPSELDIASLSTQFFMGTLDVQSLWERYGHTFVQSQAGGEGPSSSNQSPGQQGNEGGGVQGIDFDSLLEEELFRERPSQGLSSTM